MNINTDNLYICLEGLRANRYEIGCVKTASAWKTLALCWAEDNNHKDQISQLNKFTQPVYLSEEKPLMDYIQKIWQLRFEPISYMEIAIMKEIQDRYEEMQNMKNLEDGQELTISQIYEMAKNLINEDSFKAEISAEVDAKIEFCK